MILISPSHVDRDCYVILGCFAAFLVACEFEERESLAWEKPDKTLAARAAQCGQRYLVVNLDGTLRCAQLVPGITWQPYLTVQDEEEARQAYLRKLRRQK